MSCVTCHQSQQPQSLLTPPLCTIGWFNNIEPQKTQRKFKTNQKGKNLPFFVSNMLFDQKSPDLFVPVANGGYGRKTTDDKHTSIAIYGLNWPRS